MERDGGVQKDRYREEESKKIATEKSCRDRNGRGGADRDIQDGPRERENES